MKKIILLPLFCSTFISTNTFGMLLKKIYTISTAKDPIQTKKFCNKNNKKQFNYDEIILQTITDNNALKEENRYLKQKLELSLAIKTGKMLTDTQQGITFRSEDKRSSSQE